MKQTRFTEAKGGQANPNTRTRVLSPTSANTMYLGVQYKGVQFYQSWLSIKNMPNRKHQAHFPLLLKQEITE